MFGDATDPEEAIVEKVVAAAHEAAFVLDARGDVIACNDVAAALVGATREGVLGRSLGDLGLRPDADASDGCVRALLDPEAAPARRDRFVLAEPSGGQRLVRVSRAALGEEGGAPWLVFVSRWDTRPLGTPEQLHEERLAAIGRLTAAVTHDFNNVLAVLLGTGELLLRKLAPDDPRRPLARDLVGAAVRGCALTRAILALSGARGDGARLLEVNAVVRDLAGMLTRLVGDDVELVLRLESGTAQVRVDPLLLEQVLLNLATNARDAMPAGGRITFTTLADADLVTIEVADTGLGMDPDTSHRVFDPFFTTKPRGEGTGLGLASARAIIDRHGGRISVESEPGRGSRFTIRLPVAHGTDDELEASSGAPSKRRASSLSVLLVESDDAVRASLRGTLEAGGHEVVDAATGAGALRLLDACDGLVDALLVDAVLADVQGPALAKRILARYPRVTTVLMSGRRPDVLADLGIDPAMVRLWKPISAQDLLAVVRGTGR